MAGTRSLTEAEEAALRGEAARIAREGGAWEPTEEALREVVESVMRAASEERRRLQGEGIAAARRRGVRLGRPEKSRPEGYAAAAAAVRAGALTRVSAARSLGVSCETLRKWMRSDAAS